MREQLLGVTRVSSAAITSARPDRQRPEGNVAGLPIGVATI